MILSETGIITPGLQDLLELPAKVGDDQRAVFEGVFQGMDRDDDRSISLPEFAAFLRRAHGQPVASEVDDVATATAASLGEAALALEDTDRLSAPLPPALRREAQPAGDDASAADTSTAPNPVPEPELAPEPEPGLSAPLPPALRRQLPEPEPEPEAQVLSSEPVDIDGELAEQMAELVALEGELALVSRGSTPAVAAACVATSYPQQYRDSGLHF